MKKLILIRHAKSDWSMSLDDFDRTLTQRGKDDAKAVAREFKQSLPDPLTIWSSSARRASLTADIMIREWNLPPDRVDFKFDLYTFNWQRLADIIRQADDSIDCLCIFGHNEGITEFVNNFGDIYIDNVPTAGLVCLDFEANRWQDISQGKITRTLFPKSLR